MKLAVHLVTWNGAKYMPYLFDSLRNQTYTDWSLLIVDNASTDGMVEAVKKELGHFPVPHRLIENTENFGFAGGHNMAFQQTSAEYVILLNQDLFLTTTCFERLMQFIEHHPGVASVAPRLMKWNFDAVANSGLEHSLTHQIDSLGLKVFRNRRVIEQYAQQEWEQVKQHDVLGTKLEVFGVSGALPLLRRSAIRRVAYADGSLFDPAYHSYKEDVDLAFRLVAAGYSSYVVLDAVAYHDRSAAGPKELKDVAAAENKKKQSHLVKYHSYKNHLSTLYKNEYWQNVILDLPWIVWYELKKFVYYLLFDPAVLAGLKELWRMRHELVKKRRWIAKMRTARWWAVRTWWREKRL